MQTHKKLVAIACEACASQANLARASGLSPAMVNQLSKGLRNVPLERAAAFEAACHGRVRRWDLFPDNWHHIWPELVGADGAPATPHATPHDAPRATAHATHHATYPTTPQEN